MKKIIDTLMLLLVAMVPLAFFVMWSIVADKNRVDNVILLLCSIACIGIIAHTLFLPKVEISTLKFRIFWIGGLLGTIFFMAIFGLQILSPTNIAWIMYNKPDIDNIQHFLGWHYFRYEPWIFPLGNINNFGAPIGTSVAHTDALPLLAIPFKLIRSILPENFQFIGIWVLLCYMLQGIFGALLVNLVTDDIILIFLGAMFFIISPIMRMPFQGALSAHCAMLYGIWLNFSKIVRKGYHWFFLLLVVAWIHPYLYAMCFGLYFADSLARIFQKTLPVKQFFYEFIIILGFSVAFFWLAGYFQAGIMDIGSPLFGFASMNLNSLFNPSFMNCNRSIFLNQLEVMYREQLDGFAYLGLGVILLLFNSVLVVIPEVGRIKRDELKKYLPLIVVMLAFFLFAVSNKVTFNKNLLFEIPIPSMFKFICEIFRASGRFIWPVYYLIVCFAIWIIVRAKKLKYMYKVFLILGAVCIQFIDLSKGWLRPLQTAHKIKREWSTTLQSVKWQLLAKKYNKFIYVPNYKSPMVNSYTYFTPPDDYEDFTFFAAGHDMSVSSGYFARIDHKKMQRYSREIFQDFMHGNLDPNAVYIITDNKMLKFVVKNKAYKNICIKHIDQYYVATRNSASNSGCLTVNELLLINKPSISAKSVAGK